jgi:Uma2 family endonuclease
VSILGLDGSSILTIVEDSTRPTPKIIPVEIFAGSLRARKKKRMANTTITPEFQTFPNRRRWTRDECHRLAELGFLDGRYELVDGEILSLMGQNPPHRMTLILIAGWLASVFGFYVVQTQGPIAIIGEEGETNEPEPDIAVTSEPTTAYLTRHPEPQELLLAVEVSDTTLVFDLNTKARLYARHDVQEYWVMDVNGRCLHRHRDPSPQGYTDIVILAAEQTISPMARPDVAVRVHELLSPVEN